MVLSKDETLEIVIKKHETKMELAKFQYELDSKLSTQNHVQVMKELEMSVLGVVVGEDK